MNVADDTQDKNQAADLIRQKLARAYDEEPDAKLEMAEAEVVRPRSKHQQFMHELSRSGKNLAQIQTEWHNYYINLPDDEKHQVWREFYAEHNRRLVTKKLQKMPEPAPAPQPKHSYKSAGSRSRRQRATDHATIAALKQHLLQQVITQAKERASHMRSLLFGLSCGLVVVAIFLFGFFNERFLVPFMRPSSSISNTPIIIDPTNTKAGPEPKIIIPKINVELPVVYDEPSIEEDAVQRALEDGVLHYATTPNPGEKGNGVIFGHSSNNIFNRGKYKFAFVMLKRLEKGDTFMLEKDSKRYVYKIFEKRVVPPSDVSVLDPVGNRPATFTLITCDPPGTSLNRLVVIGEQITPNPSKNATSTAKTQQASPAILPSNSESLWHRFTNWLSR